MCPIFVDAAGEHPSPHHQVPSVAFTLLGPVSAPEMPPLSAACTSGVRFVWVSTRRVTRATGSWPVWIGVLLAAAASAGCAGESSAHLPCPSDAWAGTCKLAGLKKVEEREMPMPYVVYEAIYAPEANVQYPQFTPAEVRLRFGTPARSEFALSEHLKAQVRVACRAKAALGSCLPGELLADVAPFDP